MTLGTAYKQAMDRIVVTEEMRARILSALPPACREEKKTAFLRRPAGRWAAAACLGLLLAGAALPLLPLPAREGTTSSVQGGIRQAVEVASLAELVRTVGFEVEKLEYLPFSVERVEYTAFGTDMAQVRYEGAGQTVVFRKMAGSGDPSGDYTQYPCALVLERDGVEVTLRGTQEGYQLAVWQEGAYACSLRASLPLPEEQWERMALGTGGT